MEKIYHYKNATVTIKPPTPEQYSNIQKATEKFMEKVIRGDRKYGHTNQTRTINKQ